MQQQELTIDEACQQRLLDPEAMARSCNPDGTVKHSTSATVSLKNNPDKTISVNAYTIGGAVAGLIFGIVVVTLAILVVRGRGVKSPPTAKRRPS